MMALVYEEAEIDEAIEESTAGRASSETLLSLLQKVEDDHERDLQRRLRRRTKWNALRRNALTRTDALADDLYSRRMDALWNAFLRDHLPGITAPYARQFAEGLKEKDLDAAHPRFWFDAGVLDHLESVRSEVMRRCGYPGMREISLVEIRMALETRASRDRQRGTKGELAVSRATSLDGEDIIHAPKSKLGWVVLRPSVADTYLRWWVDRDVGLVNKIGVAERLEGLGLARRMIEAMIDAHPEVQTWKTTYQRAPGAKLLKVIAALYPQYGWESGVGRMHPPD